MCFKAKQCNQAALARAIKNVHNTYHQQSMWNCTALQISAFSTWSA